jgi:hypothetical protein
VVSLPVLPAIEGSKVEGSNHVGGGVFLVETTIPLVKGNAVFAHKQFYMGSHQIGSDFWDILEGARP